MRSAELLLKNVTCVMNTDNTIAGLMLFMTGTIGCIANVIAAVFLIRLPQLRNAFGILMFGMTVASAGVLAQSGWWMGSMIFFVDCRLSTTDFGIFMETSSNFVYYAALFGHHTIGINRCIAISSPFSYRRWFSNGNAVILATVPYIIATLMMAWTLLACPLFVHPIRMSPGTPAFLAGTCGPIGNVEYVAIVFIVILDGYTFFRLRMHSRKMSINTNTGAGDRQRYRQETRFFMQAAVIDLLLLLVQFDFYFIGPLFLTHAGKWPIFLNFALPYLLMHSGDAFIILTFNPEIRRFIKSANASDKSIVQLQTKHNRLSLSAAKPAQIAVTS